MFVNPSSEPNFTVSERSAKAQAHEGLGVLTERGEKCHRVALLQGKDRENLNDRFNVAVISMNGRGEFEKGQKTQSLWKRVKRHFTHVKVETKSGKKTYLNIKDAAYRLGITPREVKRRAKQEGLHALREVAEVREKSLDEYDAIVEKVKTQNESSDRVSLQEETGIDPKLLYSIISKAEKKFRESRTATFHYDSLLGKNFIYDGEKVKGNKLMEVQKVLGKGEFGTVYKISSVADRHFQRAMKIASVRHSKGDLANSIEDMEWEYANLSELNPDGNIPGIQKCPSKVTKITHLGQPQSNVAFYVTELMSGDLYSLSKDSSLSPQRKLTLLTSLFIGLAHVHRKGFIHGDIKLENCLYKDGNDGAPQKFVLADFGGARKINQGFPNAWTPQYLPSDVENNKQGREKADVFALGRTAIELLTNRHQAIWDLPVINRHCVNPIKKNGSRYQRIEDALEKFHIPNATRNVLLRAIGPAENRPTAEEIANVMWHDVPMPDYPPPAPPYP